MPFVPVPKDLTKVKNKVAFNLTPRQLWYGRTFGQRNCARMKWPSTFSRGWPSFS